MKRKIARTTGFTLIEIMIVVAIIGMLATMAIPGFIHAHAVARTNACINNLRCIDNAKQQWALEKRATDTAIPLGSDLQPYLGPTAGGELPSCPLDAAQSFASSYSPQSVAEKPLCLIDSANHVMP
jgi:prepilin-type N-terminal cleavage/methylation domain-containing protein